MRGFSSNRRKQRRGFAYVPGLVAVALVLVLIALVLVPMFGMIVEVLNAWGLSGHFVDLPISIALCFLVAGILLAELLLVPSRLSIFTLHNMRESKREALTGIASRLTVLLLSLGIALPMYLFTPVFEGMKLVTFVGLWQFVLLLVGFTVAFFSLIQGGNHNNNEVAN